MYWINLCWRMIVNLSVILMCLFYYRERCFLVFLCFFVGYLCLERLKWCCLDVKVIFNVGGWRFVMWKNILKCFFGIFFGLEEFVLWFYDKDKKEYFIDCDLYLFCYILNYYCCGKFYCFFEDCNVLFEEELFFYGIRF